MNHHWSALAIGLSVAVLTFVACALGLVSPLHQIATVVGMVLVTAMACGLFFATLHLQKIH